MSAGKRVVLTERLIRSLKPAATGTRYSRWDAIVPGLDVQVTDTGHKSFGLKKRFPAKPQHPTRRKLGDVGAITLEQARPKARHWLELITKGIDPAVDEARQRAEAQRTQINTFASVGAEFLERHARGLAKYADAKRSIAEFAKRWGPRPITDIQPDEVAAAVRAIVKRGAPYQAHNALGYLRRLYSWAEGTREFGVTSSPVAGLRPADLIGKRQARARVLTDDELRAVWAACGGRFDAGALAETRRRDRKPDATVALDYPYGPLFRLLLLTGQRETEIAALSWSEINLDEAMITIPAARMKSARAHELPLAPDALALLRSLPRFAAGGFVFTTTGGLKPVNGFSRAKQRLDRASGVTEWVLHDLRRSVRTHFSALPVQDVVREAVIAHARPGLHRVYDQHSYVAEKRECLTLWEARLRRILSPPPAHGNVTAIWRDGGTAPATAAVRLG